MMAALLYSPNAHRAVVAAALLSPPSANPWLVPSYQRCTRHALLRPCYAAKHQRDGPARSSSSSSSRTGSRGSSSSSRENTGSAWKHERAQYSSKASASSSRTQQNSLKPSVSSPPKGRSSSQSTNRSVVDRNAEQSAPKSSPLPDHAPLLVVGAGAAGLTAAYFAAKQGAQVVVLERTREAGKKVLMSGGTRCNVLPQDVDLPLDYVTSSSKSALRAVFASWTLDECHAWLSRDICLRLVLEEETRKYFPASNSGREVRDRLVAACQDLGVRFVYNASVEDILPPSSQQHQQQQSQLQGLNQQQQQQQQSGHGDQPGQALQEPRHSPPSSKGISKGSPAAAGAAPSCWRVGLSSGAAVSADVLVVSTGGYSFPAVGTDGTGLRLLTGLGHKLSDGDCYAALTPLKGPHPGGEQLAGLTLAGVQLSVLKGGSNKVLAAAQRGGLLFTHKGYSGPAILDVSHWLVKELDRQRHQQHGQQQQQEPPPRLVVDWTGEGLQVWQQRFAGAPGSTTVNSLLRKHGIKERLANALASEVGVTNKPLSQLRKGEKEQLLTALTAWQLPIQAHEGYPKAEVTGGGVPLEDVNCKTMESRVLPRLYLCGEVLDVFGRIGGFNFWWAWLSGRLAGQAAAAAVLQTAAAKGPAAAATGTARRSR